MSMIIVIGATVTYDHNNWYTSGVTMSPIYYPIISISTDTMKQYCCIDVFGYKNKLCIFVGPSNDSLYDYVVYVICDQIHVHVKTSEITFLL